MSLDLALKQIYLTRGVADLIVFGAGVLNGCYHGAGVEWNSKVLHNSFVFAPLFFQTAMGTFNGKIEKIAEHEDSSRSVFKGTFTGFGLGALEMGAGYCVGYAIGGLFR